MTGWNKSEMLAFDYLTKKGHKNIFFRYNKTPDFNTDKGYYEIKRGYKMKTGDVKIIFSEKQRERIIACDGKVLVFLDSPEPIDILEGDELNQEKVRNIVLHNIERSKDGEQISVVIRTDIVTEMDNMIKKDMFASRSSILRRAVKEFIDRQKILA